MAKAAKTIEAVYENGVFKPVKKVKLPEHERFELIISPAKETEKNAAEIKKLVERQKDAFFSIAGIGSSGLGDVSENHDKYLYGEPCVRK